MTDSQTPVAAAAALPLVDCRGLVRRFGTVAAVDGVSFAIARGEFFSLLGPSGCGKTTTLRLLAGFETPDAGTVAIAGQVVNQLRPYERPIGMVFQSYALFPHMSVFGNVAFGLEQRHLPRDEIRRRVADALALVRLDAGRFGARRPGQLSGGQRQRVALARALVLRPEILLLDEPLGALDLKLRKAMQLELKALNRELGTTFVYVTHDQEEALTMSDRLAVMDGGRIVQLGSPAEVYRRPRTAFVAEFIGESNLLAGTVAERRGAGWMVEGGAGRFVIAGGTGLGVGDRVRIALRPEQLRLNRGEAAVEGENALAGTVEDLIYRGEVTHLLVRLPDETVIRTALLDGGAHPSAAEWRRGERALVSWAPEAGHLLEAE